MEQKQLDELENSFFGEEYIEDESEEQQEIKPEPELRLKKVQKTAAKKASRRKLKKPWLRGEMSQLETKKK